MELLISAPPRNFLLIFGALMIFEIINVIATNESSVSPSYLNTTTDALNVEIFDEDENYENNVSGTQETSTVIARRKIKYEMKAPGLGVATWKEISLTRDEDINDRQGRSFAGQQVSRSSNVRNSVWILRIVTVVVAILR